MSQISETLTLPADSRCKLVPYSTFLQLKGGEQAYQEALEASAKFNRELDKDRRSRVPFLESQTRVAQTLNNTLCLEPYQRLKRRGYAVAYPLASWYKRSRLLTEGNDTSTVFQQTHQVYLQHKTNANSSIATELNESSGSMDSFSTHHQYHHHNSQYSGGGGGGYNSSTMNLQQSHSMLKQPFVSVLPAASSANIRVSSIQEEDHQKASYYLDDDGDENNDSDGSDYEGRKRKKKSKQKRSRSDLSQLNGEDKPYICEKCGAKYKTKPGLHYHMQKGHSTGPNGVANVSGQPKAQEITITDENTTNSMAESVAGEENTSSNHQ